MSPENDQTRWIGVRPTNPKEDIPITLDGEVAHVIVDSGGGAGIEPTELVYSPVYQATTVSGTWYTVLNRSDPGWLFMTAMRMGAVTKAGYIGITLNGGVRQSIQVYPTGTHIFPIYRSYGNDAYGFEWNGIRFKTSIKVEVRQDWASWLNGACLTGFD